MKFYHLHSKSLAKHNAKNLKELWGKMKAKGYDGLSMEVNTVFKKSASDSNRFHAIFSTASLDRHGEIVEQSWDLKSFKKNPVYLDSHNYESIEHIIGKIEKIKVSKGQLVGDIIFALDNPVGKLASDLATGGFLNTNSVGFIPLKYNDSFDTIIKSELLEVSAVSVPANPEALYDKKNKEDKKTNKQKDIADNGKNKKRDNKENGEKKEQNDSEPKQKEVKKISIKTPKQLIDEVVKEQVDIRVRALNKILNATKLVCSELKVGERTKDALTEKSLVNKTVRELLDFKKALKK